MVSTTDLISVSNSMYFIIKKIKFLVTKLVKKKVKVTKVNELGLGIFLSERKDTAGKAGGVVHGVLF